MTNNGRLHHEILQDSAADDAALGEAVQTRFVELLNDWLRTRGEKLVPPPELASAVRRWREMCGRHARGDFRHRDSEIQATREVAQWTVDRKMELAGQAPKEIEWPI